ncbi:hypothetical protein D5041_07755 [Verminephrobacter aporrectodeae subsp. tuberculatae]|nr:hypothetical protein [Verminephrobacter aporrectodeae subsp. tuberculatae]MCW5288958.1 hypothetical protein [Verminephrobacter aporrectodeae subsp. tuberculatae]
MSGASVPAQLQVNVVGAWKTVLAFDAGDVFAAENVQQGARLLFEAAPGTSWRIATREGRPQVLSHLGQNTYGIWIARKARM